MDGYQGPDNLDPLDLGKVVESTSFLAKVFEDISVFEELRPVTMPPRIFRGIASDDEGESDRNCDDCDQFYSIH